MPGRSVGLAVGLALAGLGASAESPSVLYTDRLEALREALVAAGHAPGEISLRSWGDRDFRVRDPEGYYVRVTEGVAVRRSPP